MTSKTTTLTQEPGRLERFLELPPREDMQNTSHLHLQSVLTSLLIHFSKRHGTLVHGEVPVAPTLEPWEGYRVPDLIVAFDCDIADVYRMGGYALDRQGKPPDFVLEVASKTTGIVDYTAKRLDYQRNGIPEYWRFDPTEGEYHDTALAGDRLLDGEYQPIEIKRLGESRWRGYSEALGLFLYWEDARLRFYDPIAQTYLRTHQEAEGRVSELEAEIRRLRGE